PPPDVPVAGERSAAVMAPADAIAGLVRRRIGFSSKGRIGSEPMPGTEAILIEMEPVDVWRAPTRLENVMERPESATGVIEHPVEDHSDPPGVSPVEQLAEGLDGAE